jgi:hypothetical protein
MKKKEELIELLYRNKDFAKLYYSTKVYEQQYACIDKYSFEQFNSLIKKIHALKINSAIINKLKKSLGKSVNYQTSRNKGGLRKIIENCIAGKPLVNKKNKAVRFQAVIEKNPYEDQIIKLNKIWRVDLNRLLLENVFGNIPQNLESPIPAYIKKVSTLPEIRKLKILRRRLKLDERITPQKISLISNDLKHSLKQKCKGQEDKNKELNESSEAKIISEYIIKYIPSTPEAKIWKKNFARCLNTIKQINKEQRKTKQLVKTQLELTFLDKNSDFFRSIRFGDAVHNCINSNRKPQKLRNYIRGTKFILLPIKVCTYIANILLFNPVNTIATIYRNPFSFIIDIKEVNTNYIIGFVAGNLAVNPITGGIILMVNDIYMRGYNKEVTTKILTIIEENIGKYVKAEGIMFAKKTEEDALQASGFREEIIDVFPLVGVSNPLGLPVKIGTDDFGNRVNSTVKIACLYKNLRGEIKNAREQDEYLEKENKPNIINAARYLNIRFIITGIVFALILFAVRSLKLFNPNSNGVIPQILEYSAVSLAVIIKLFILENKNFSLYTYLLVEFSSILLIFFSIFLYIGDKFLY